jgi:EpsI family protein
MKKMLPAIALVVLLGGIAVAFWTMLTALHFTWIDKYGALSHGYLVVALSLWFAWRALHSPTRPRPSSPAWSAAPVLAALLLVAALSEVLYMGPIRTGVLPLLVLASIALCMGRQMVMAMAWPVLFLYFAVPVWGFFNAPLQSLTTWIAQSLLPLLGVPVFVEGNFVHLPAGLFEIASGCSGLNYFVAALTLAAVYATVLLRTWRSRISLMLAAAAAGLAANWVRVVSLIVIGQVTKMQHYLIRVDHLYYGWALFLLTMIPVFMLARRLEDREIAAGSSTRPPMTLPAWIPVWCARGVWAAAIVVPLAVLLMVVRERAPGTMTEDRQDPLTSESTVEREAFASGWQPTFKWAEEQKREWSAAGVIEIYTAAYSRQSREARLSDPGNSVTGPSFQVTGSGTIEGTGLASGTSVLELRGELGGRERLLWTWYDVAGRTAWSKPTLRTAELLGLLSGRRDAKVIALLAECQGDCDRARTRIRTFLSTHSLVSGAGVFPQ